MIPHSTCRYGPSNNLFSTCRYDPRHGPSIYKNKYEDNTQLEGSEFDKHYRTKDDVEVKFTDRRIDRLKNPTRSVNSIFNSIILPPRLWLFYNLAILV